MKGDVISNTGFGMRHLQVALKMLGNGFPTQAARFSEVGHTCELPVPHISPRPKRISFRLFANSGITLPVVILVTLVLYGYRERS